MRLIKDLLPLVALVLGFLGSRWFSPFVGLIPWAIAAMLFLTFLGVPPRGLRLERAHFFLLGIELLLIALGLAVYSLAPSLGVGLVLLLMTPTATAAPSIVFLLGGNVGFVASSMLLAHGLVVGLAPVVLPVITSGSHANLSFLAQATEVLLSIAPLVLLPIVLAWGLRAGCPQIAQSIVVRKRLPYFIWLSSLVLLMAHTGQLLTDYAEVWSWSDLTLYLILGFVVCALEFALGHYIAPILGGERQAIRQSLGQKNTTLALWLATNFLPPLTATAAASYILWQNLFITIVMMRRSSLPLANLSNEERHLNNS